MNYVSTIRVRQKGAEGDCAELHGWWNNLQKWFTGSLNRCNCLHDCDWLISSPLPGCLTPQQRMNCSPSPARHPPKPSNMTSHQHNHHQPRDPLNETTEWLNVLKMVIFYHKMQSNIFQRCQAIESEPNQNQFRPKSRKKMRIELGKP